MSSRDEVKAVASVLKGRFNNLTVEETIDLAYDILRALEVLAISK